MKFEIERYKKKVNTRLNNKPISYQVYIRGIFQVPCSRNFEKIVVAKTRLNETKYSRMEQVKFVEDRL